MAARHKKTLKGINFPFERGGSLDSSLCTINCLDQVTYSKLSR